jgi:hypothetical protein
MRISPHFLAPVPREWSDFRGIVPVDLNQMEIIFPGFSAAGEISLKIPVAPLLGHMQFSELAIVVAVVRTLGATSFAEIGTFDGLTILNLLENCPDLRTIYTVDLPEGIRAHKGAGSVFPIDSINASMIDSVDIGRRFATHPRSSVVIPIREDSALVSPLHFPIEPEVFFIDGSHTFDYCWSDTQLARKVTSPGGVLIWHDYGNPKYLPGVTEALLRLSREGEMKLYWLDCPQLRTSLVFGIRCI